MTQELRRGDAAPIESSRRILCVYLPHLATDRVRCGRSAGESSKEAAGGGCATSAKNAAEGGCATSDLSSRPLVLTRRVGSTVIVSYACPRARQVGIESGITLGEAQALLPGLLVLDHEEHADRALLLQLAEWAAMFSPRVEPVFPAALLLDVSGCRRLYTPRAMRAQAGTSPVDVGRLADRRLAEQVVGALLRDGLHARAAVADTVGAAIAIATACDAALTIAADGQTSGYLASLPPASLRIDERTADTLDRLGVRTIGDLLVLPRSSLASRFGPHLGLRLQQALGEVFEPVTPYIADPPAAVRIGFESPVRDRVAIQRVALRLLDDLLPQVFDRQGALRRLDCLIYDDQAQVTTLHVGFSRATRVVERVVDLLRQKIETASLPRGATAIHLIAGEVVHWRAQQGDLFAPTDPNSDEQLGELLDRVTNRLGHASVVRAELVDDFQPECAFRYVPVADVGLETKLSEPKPVIAAQPRFELPRPLQMFERPIPVRVVATVPDGPPTWFAFAGREYAVADAWGPERIETAWWRGSDVRRDYFRVASASGEQFWLYFDGGAGQWFVHGVFV